MSVKIVTRNITREFERNRFLCSIVNMTRSIPMAFVSFLFFIEKNDYFNRPAV